MDAERIGLLADLEPGTQLEVYRSEVRGNLSAFRRMLDVMWRVVAVLLILVLLNGAVALVAAQQATAAKSEIVRTRESGFKNRSILCLTVVLDNDRTFEVPAQCLGPDVARYYPLTTCYMFGNPEGCGSASRER